MQQRHKDRQQYFNESAATSRDYYLDYLRAHVTLREGLRVLEIGCGEGGNLLPFAEQTKKVEAGEEVLVLLYKDKSGRPFRVCRFCNAENHSLV